MSSAKSGILFLLLYRCLRIQWYKCRLLINQINIVVSLYSQSGGEFSHSQRKYKNSVITRITDGLI